MKAKVKVKIDNKFMTLTIRNVNINDLKDVKKKVTPFVKTDFEIISVTEVKSTFQKNEFTNDELKEKQLREKRMENPKYKKWTYREML